MASLQLQIGAEITRKYAHNLLIDVYTLNFYSIRLSTLASVASDLLNDALRLENDLPALAATCSLRSVNKVQINHLGLQDPLWNRKIQWRVSKVSSCKFSWKFYIIRIKVFFSLSENLELIRRVTSLLSPSENMQFRNEQIRTQPLFSPPCASATYHSARMCRRKNDDSAN